MKKVIILFAALLAGSVAFAQSKGDMYVGGGLTFGTSTSSSSYSIDGVGSGSSDSSTSASFSFTPSFGYFVMDNLKVGGSVNYSYSGETNKFLVGPEVAYYLRLADNFYYTPELGLYGGILAGSGDALGAFSFKLSLVQAEYRPFEKFALSVDLMNMNYLLLSRSEKGESYSYGTFNFNLLMNATVGVKYYF